jgi:hypothetical protein
MLLSSFYEKILVAIITNNLKIEGAREERERGRNEIFILCCGLSIMVSNL